MKKILTVMLVMVIGYTSQAATSDYFVNDAQVEQVLNDAQINDLNTADFDFNYFSTTAVQAEKNLVVALVLDFFLGGLAIHRVYLGGKGSLILIYFITCGGIFGVVPLVDFFIMIGNLDQFIDNDKFIAW